MVFAGPGDAQKEAEYHGRFAPYRLCGEWFLLHPAVAGVVAGHVSGRADVIRFDFIEGVSEAAANATRNPSWYRVCLERDDAHRHAASGVA